MILHFKNWVCRLTLPHFADSPMHGNCRPQIKKNPPHKLRPWDHGMTAYTQLSFIILPPFLPMMFRRHQLSCAKIFWKRIPLLETRPADPTNQTNQQVVRLGILAAHRLRGFAKVFQHVRATLSLQDTPRCVPLTWLVRPSNFSTRPTIVEKWLPMCL